MAPRSLQSFNLLIEAAEIAYHSNLLIWSPVSLLAAAIGWHLRSAQSIKPTTNVIRTREGTGVGLY